MKRSVLVAAVFVIFVVGNVAAQVGMPQGQWWNMPGVVDRLDLTAEQQAGLDKIFLSSAPELIDLKAAVEKRSLELRAQLEQSELNRENIRKAADAVSKARGDLFARELMMMIDMRSVLNDEQWVLLRRALDERATDRKDRRPQPDRPEPPRRRN